jgi:O-methyltransferase involved in polyketide biosynthesis
MAEPDNTAVRTALWRALHLEVDAPPYLLEDRIGLQLAAPEDGWRDRSDMDPRLTAGFRASIVARARYLEDVVEERAAAGDVQYVIMGLALTPSRSGGRTWPGECECSRSTSPGRRNGNGGG